MKIIVGSIVSCGVAASFPENAAVEFSAGEIVDCGKGVEVRDSPDYATSLGLPSETPPQEIRNALMKLRDGAAKTPEDAAKMLGSEKIWTWVDRAGNAASVISALLTAASMIKG